MNGDCRSLCFNDTDCGGKKGTNQFSLQPLYLRTFFLCSHISRGVCASYIGTLPFSARFILIWCQMCSFKPCQLPSNYIIGI